MGALAVCSDQLALSPTPKCALNRNSILFRRWRNNWLVAVVMAGGILEGNQTEDVVPNKIVMLVVALVIFHLGVLVSFLVTF